MHDLAFLHGGGQGSWVWNETIAALRSQTGVFQKILTLDIPGCGAKRGRVTDSLQPHDVARELIGDLERADMQRVVLVGHSMAGNVMPALAELNLGLFQRLIYLTCSVPLPGQTIFQMLGTGLHGSNDNEVGWPIDPGKTSLTERYVAIFCNDMSAEQKHVFLKNLQHDEWPRSYFTTNRFRFKNLGQVPATYIVCLQDQSLPVAWQEKFAERFRVERIVQIDAGHQAMITRPQELAELLRQEAMTAGFDEPT